MESSSAWLAVLITVVAVLCSVLPAVADEKDNGEQAAREFADAFMADPESTRDQLTETINAALTKQAVAQISIGLEMALGKFQGSRVARWVDTVEGNRRYRIPLEFERGMRDMMLVTRRWRVLRR